MKFSWKQGFLLSCSVILVTGATGLVGAATVVQLLEAGKKVRAFCRRPQRAQTHPLLQHVWNHDHLEWFQGDITELDDLEKAFDGVYHVIHAAAVVSYWPPKSAEMFRINIEGTANVVNLCSSMGIEKLVHISSIASLGKVPFLGADPDRPSLVDESFPWDPSAEVSDYSISKFKSEMEVWRGQEEGISTLILNPGVIVGPGFWNDSSARLFQTVFRGLKFYSPGMTGYVSVWDVARAAVWGIETSISGERFVLVSENRSFNDFFQSVAQSMNVSPPSWCPPRWLSELAWRLIEWKSKISKSEPMITQSTVRSAYSVVQYNGSKFTRMSGIAYEPLESAIQQTGQIFLNELGIKK